MSTRISQVVGSVVWLSYTFLTSPFSTARDCNGNGIEDTEDIASGASIDCNANNIPDACEDWPLNFSAGLEWPLDRSPEDLAAGDLDDDGDLDLLVAQQSGVVSSLAVFLNQGNRAFELGPEILLGGALRSIALADLDGDRLPDVIGAYGDGMFTLRNNGDGHFDNPVMQSTPNQTDYVHAADLNGDGAPDVLSVNRETKTISLRMNGNEGDGTLTTPQTLTIDGTDPVSVTTADLDGDGDLDVITANQQSSDYSILLNRGDGTFEAPRTHARKSSTLDPLSVFAADLNGDGSPDLATTRSVANIISFNDGEATFQEPVSFKSKSIFSALRALHPADFDRDGDLDLATTSSREGVMIRQNDGSGDFTQVRELGLGQPTVVLEAGDFDADGWVDLALASSDPGAMAFVWNDGGGHGLTSGVEIEVLPLEGCSDSRGCRPHGGTLADLDGDGDLDGVGLMTHPGEFHFVDNRKGIIVTRPEPYTFGRNGAANGEHGQWVTPGDLDADGDTDLVSVDNNSNDFWVHINRGDGTFEAVGKDRRIRVGGAPQHVSLGDLDGDGDLDGVASNMGDGSISIITGRGDGSFDPTSIKIKTGPGTRGTAIGDLDEDGMPDLVAANSSGRSLTILRNRGDGSFPDAGEKISLTGNPYGVTLAHLDRDDHLDIAATVGNRRTCAVLLNQGDGTFAEPQYYPIDESGAYTVAAVDFNMDRHLDLVTANETAGSITILLGNGDGSFGAPTSYSAGSGAGNRMALPADLDGDGDPDIMTFNRGNHTATVFYNRSALDAPDSANHLCTVADFFQLADQTTQGAEGDPQEFVKFILPVSEDAALQETVYQNTSRYRLHQDFLTNVFSQHFPALDAATYDNLVGYRDSRQYFIGAVRVIRTPRGAIYGFDVFARFGDSKERLSSSEVQSIHAQLEESFQLSPLVYAPTSLEAVEVARAWQNEDAGFPILIEGSTGGFEPYTSGVGYGRVRLMSFEAFEEANATGGISFQDILVLERAPRDIEGVVNGIVTAERQGELSHLAVRTARRGTPNAFVRSAMEDFADLEGNLVRLQVTETGYSVRPASEEEAAAFWDANAGFLSRLPSLDADFTELSTLEDIAEIDRDDDEIVPAEARFGGKATNLARLQSILTDAWSRYQIRGFAVPMAYYLDFIRSNTMPSAFDAERQVTYEVYLQELFDSEEFTTRSEFRFETLATLREHMRESGQVDQALISRLHERIDEVMETPPNIRVRFRSSSNAEDAIEFNGAGLYDSTQGCVADDLDGDTEGPSLCNEAKNGERDLSRALRRVWSSLWNFRAVEERAFYRIPNELPAMGILVSEAFDAELANGVATTGNATNRNDPRFVITVQKDDHSVVSPEPGTLAEKNILEMSESGEVTAIIRAAASTLVEPGEFVLSDAELRELGALMWHIHTQFPVDPGEHGREDLVFEIEFKKRAGGELAVKQVRPFLLTERGPAPPAFALHIPANTILCGKFDSPNLSRSVFDEAALKAQLHLTEGVFNLPTAVDQFSSSLVEKLVLGPDRRVATSTGPGTFTHERLVSNEPGLLIYRFDYHQELAFDDGDTVDVKWALLDFHTRDGVIVEQTLLLDEAYLIDELSLQTQFEHEGEIVTNFYGSCTMELLPLWEIEVELDDGTSLTLAERFRDEAFGDFQPAALVEATIDLGSQEHHTADYWDLIYKATRHNEHVEYLIHLHPPMEFLEMAEPVHAIRLVAPTHDHESDPVAIYLDGQLQALDTRTVLNYRREAAVAKEQEPTAISVTVQSFPLDGLPHDYLTISFHLTPEQRDHGDHRVQSSEDLQTWKANAVRVSAMENEDGSLAEVWRSPQPINRTRSGYLRLQFE